MRPDTKLKVARRKHTVELLRWLYSRRDAKVDGARLSLDHRERQEGGVSDSRWLTYGEVDVPDFLAILDIVKPREGEVFVDLGSGTGKAVLASSCGFPEFSKCLGIELVQGLAEAAADHLRTVKTFLSERTSPGTASAQRNTDNTRLATKDIAAKTGSSPTGAHRDERHARGGGGGKGGGGKNGKASGSKAASSRGLNATDLEALIADLLSRQPRRSLHPPRPPQSRKVSRAGVEKGGDSDGDAAVRGEWEATEREATTEEVASWLVSKLGHRRYKDSLRGYGGLQKFLMARRKVIDSGTPSRLNIAENGSKVTAAAPASVCPPLVVWEALRDEGAAVKGSEKTEKRGMACCDCTAGWDCACPCGCAKKSSVATAAVDAAAIADVPASAAVANAAASVTSAVSSALSNREPFSDSALTSLPARTVPSTEASTSTSPLSSLSSSRAGPTPTDEIAGSYSTTSEAATRTRAPDSGGGSSGDSRKCGGGLHGMERRRLPEEGPLTCESLSGVEMVWGDIFEEDWSDAGVVYVASLLFSDGMMIQLSKAVKKLRQGARVISLRKIPTLTEDGEIPSQSEQGVTASINGGNIPSRSGRGVPVPVEGGEISYQSEQRVPPFLEGGEVPSQSERDIPSLTGIGSGGIPSQLERGVLAPIAGGEMPSQSERRDEGGSQCDSGSGRATMRQPALRLLHEGMFRMSWQMARVYIYVRT